MSARYARQQVLVGDAGQARLAAATVVVDGDGLTSEVAALYLVGAGVGRVDVAPALVARVRDQNAEVVVSSEAARADAAPALHATSEAEAWPAPVHVWPEPTVGTGTGAPGARGEDAVDDPVGVGAELARRALLALLGLGGAA